MTKDEIEATMLEAGRAKSTGRAHLKSVYGAEAANALLTLDGLTRVRRAIKTEDHSRLIGIEHDLAHIGHAFRYHVDSAHEAQEWATKYYYAEIQPGRTTSPFIYLPRTPTQFFLERKDQYAKQQ